MVKPTLFQTDRNDRLCNNLSVKGNYNPFVSTWVDITIKGSALDHKGKDLTVGLTDADLRSFALAVVKAAYGDDAAIALAPKDLPLILLAK